MSASVSIGLNTAEKTASLGKSLAKSLYHFPVDILLSGELGAGKTTFVQGLASGLGISEAITSPTYALEQRYHTNLDHEFVHIDLYRLSPEQVMPLLHASDDHNEIRCIEWPEKMSEPTDNPCIHIRLSEEGSGRTAQITFDDMRIPPDTEIDNWRADVRLPDHIIRHCNTVARVAVQLADALLANGVLVRRGAIEAAAKVHDLFRFVDFHDNATPPGITFDPDERAHWKTIKARYGDMTHEEVATAFLHTNGYSELAEIVRTHGLTLPASQRTTTEQQLLFYADKRVTLDQIVSVEERFQDFRERYHEGKSSSKADGWLKETQEAEHALFPEGVPTI